MHNKPLGIKMKRRLLQRQLSGFRENMASFHSMTMFLGIILTSIGGYLINSRLSQTITTTILVLGVLVATVGFVGFFGAHLEHVEFLNTYSSMTAMGLLSELGLLGLIYSYRSKFASGTWEFFMKQDPQFLIDLENSFQCCGYNSIQDRAVPKTCAIAMNVTIGCKPFVETWIQEWRQWITAGIAILLALQLIVLVISVVFAYAVDCKMREEEADMAALNYQINHTTWRHNRHGYGSRGSTASLL